MRNSNSFSGSLVMRRLGCRSFAFHLFLLLLTLLAQAVSIAHAADVVLAWEANTDPNLSGFKVYYGQASRVSTPYNASVDVTDAGARSCTVTALEAGKTYYFAATAYDVNGKESDYSTEISYTVPSVTPPPPPPPKNNNAPVAVDDGITTAEDRAVLIDVLSNDNDPDGDALSIAGVGTSTNGLVALVDGRVSFTPKANFNGVDTFTYTVADGKGGTGTGHVIVTVTPANDAPVAVNGALNLMQDSPATGSLKANDLDGDALTYTIVAQGTKGSVSITNARTGAYTYTPYVNTSGMDSFIFKVNDGSLDSNSARVDVTIAPAVKIFIEAESGKYVTPMKVVNDRTASGGRYIYVPNRTGDVVDPLKKGGYVALTFSVPVAGEYTISGLTMGDSALDDSFYVSVDSGEYLTWNIPISKGVWVWNEVKSGFSVDPMKYYLAAGSHTVIFKQRQDGAKLDKIQISSSAPSATAGGYGVIEPGVTDGWDVFDADPYGAQIINMYDEEREAFVMEMAGEGIENGYRFKDASLLTWNPQMSRLMQWSLKYNGSFVIYVDVNTTAGRRYLRYKPAAYDELGRGTYAGFALGSGFKSGDWYTFVRDLQADLSRAQPRVRILQVNAFMVRGDCSVDGVKLRGVMQ